MLMPIWMRKTLRIRTIWRAGSSLHDWHLARLKCCCPSYEMIKRKIFYDSTNLIRRVAIPPPPDLEKNEFLNFNFRALRAWDFFVIHDLCKTHPILHRLKPGMKPSWCHFQFFQPRDTFFLLFNLKMVFGKNSFLFSKLAVLFKGDVCDSALMVFACMEFYFSTKTFWKGNVCALIVSQERFFLNKI